jgi:serine/threonine protein kinase/WD40 repeat protein
MNAAAADLKAVFSKALELAEPAERARYVAQACGENVQLRAEVESLLGALDKVGSFLEAPAAALGETVEEPRLGEGPGSVIGPYKLREPIGEGGFGVVFLAEQEQPLRRKVALKVLKPGMDTRQVVARFEAERQALALMDHPNIARVFDGGETAGGRPYFVMELVKGVPITQFCDQHRLGPRARLELFVQVCAAVQHAHTKGVIHRDIKPSNVLVTVHDVTPVVKVIDFGIAKALGRQLTDRTVYTGLAEMLGTPAYMSPEQAGLSGLDVDTRSDTYSLGVLLYELLTGTTPFDQQRFRTVGYDEICRIIREEEPPRPSTRISTLGQAAATVCVRRQSDPKRLRQLLRGELDWVVMKCLEKDRGRRYETASSLARDVERYLHDEPVRACPPSLGYRLRKYVRRHKVPALAGSLVLLALVAGIIGTTWGLIRATDAEADAISEAKQKEQALTAAQQSERDAKDQLFLALWSRARAGRFGGQAGQRFDGLEALAEAGRIARARGYGEEQFLKLRNEAVACLALPDLRFERKLTEKVLHAYWIAFDPLFHYFAYGDRRGKVSICRVADGKETAHLAGPDAPPGWVGLKFSPDGRWLYVHLRDHAGRPLQDAVWEFREGKPGRKVVLEHSCDFSPDSRLVAGARPDGAVGVYETTSGREVQRIAVSMGVAGSVTFHPDGRQFAVSVKSDPGLVVVLDRETGKEVARYPHPQGLTDEAAWRGDGRLLAVPCRDQRIYVWDHARRRLQSVLEGHTGLGIQIKFSHAGDFLISTAWDESTRLWDPVTGRQLVREPGSHFVAIRHDDRQVALLKADRLELWELAGGWECRTLHHGLVGNRTDRPGDWGPRTLDFSPDGRLLVSCCLDGLGGLHRWPIRRARDRSAGQPDRTEALQVGPPEALDVPGNWIYAGLTLDRRGRWLAAVDFPRDRVILLDLERSGHKLVLEGVTACGLSPDGRWAVTWPTRKGWPLKVWDTSDGKAVSWRPPAGELLSFFTPDGRWLVSCPPGDAPLRFWQVGSWQAGPTLPKHKPQQLGFGGLVPSPDGALLFGQDPPRPGWLIDAGTGKALAALEPPRDISLGGGRFGPDGARFAAGTGNHTLHVWDLRAVRRGLADLGLDWGLPAYPPDPGIRGKPLQVEVDPGNLKGLTEAQPHLQQAAVHVRAGQWAGAVAAYSKALELCPGDARTHNNLAWLLATCPDPKLRDGGRAVKLARRAVELAPKEGEYWNTLGVAQYRAKDWTAAVEALTKADALLGDKALGFNAFFLAMAHWQLGDRPEARAWYAKAVTWQHSHKAELERNPPWREELRRFRAESAALLGIPAEAPPGGQAK